MSVYGSLLVLAAALPGQAPDTEFVHSFRHGNMPPPERMTLAGVDELTEITPEEAGLRIKILANRGKDGVGMQTRFPVTGDFEMTASYEILSADRPTEGYGVGFNVTIAPTNWQEKRAAVGRLWMPRSGSGFQALIMLGGPKPVNKYAWDPSETMKGQLRLRREGAKLQYLINDGPGLPFREMFQFEYGTDDVDIVRFVANPGKSAAAVDVRLLDVRMHWGGLPDHPAAAPHLDVVSDGLAAEAATLGARPTWHLWAVLSVLVFLLSAGLLTFYLVQQRRKGAAPSPLR
jgi:hypothetical protein